MKRLLLDTHVLLWWLADNTALGPVARSLISDAENAVYVSAATSWEISINKKKGLLEAPAEISGIVDDEGFDQLDISLFHAEKAGELEEIHRDPFDRMMVAQAQVEGLEIVTADRNIPKYAVKVIDAGK